MSEAIVRQPISSGIDALIQRLKQEGADEGRTEAQKLIADAEARVRELLIQAEAKAKHRTDEATQEAERLKRAGGEALKVAMRDAILELKEDLSTRFAQQVQGAVGKLSTDEDVLKSMILAVASPERGRHR
jgi:V/A-type H+/Na+-transporting ATPase subunit E